MSAAADLLAEMLRAGVKLELEEGDRVTARFPNPGLRDQLLPRLAANKPAVLALLRGQAPAEDVAWRAEAMRTQVAPGRPVPFLVARTGTRSDVGSCLSCGDPLVDRKARGRCPPCAEAARVVMEERG